MNINIDPIPNHVPDGTPEPYVSALPNELSTGNKTILDFMEEQIGTPRRWPHVGTPIRPRAFELPEKFIDQQLRSNAVTTGINKALELINKARSNLHGAQLRIHETAKNDGYQLDVRLILPKGEPEPSTVIRQLILSFVTLDWEHNFTEFKRKTNASFVLGKTTNEITIRKQD